MLGQPEIAVPADAQAQGGSDIVEVSCDPDRVPVQGAMPVLSDNPGPAAVPPKEEEASPAKDRGVLIAVDSATKHEGSRDFDALLKEQGQGYMMRRMAKSMGYGVGKVHQTIEQEILARETDRLEHKMFDSRDPMEDKPVKILPQWDGDALVLATRNSAGAALPTTRFGLLAFVLPRMPRHVFKVLQSCFRHLRSAKCCPEAQQWKEQLEAMKAARLQEEHEQQAREAAQAQLIKSWEIEVQQMKVERNEALCSTWCLKSRLLLARGIVPQLYG
eukprot:s2203_g2.t1